MSNQDLSQADLAAARRVGLLRPAYAVAITLGAALIFAVQPMFAKMVLPLLGGSPGVWNVALAFFQAALLAGYLYAHLLTRYVPLRQQLAIHLVVVGAAGLTLPIAVSTLIGAPPADFPGLWLFGLFALSVGAPFAVVSATSPLLQAWYARSDAPDRASPYTLYAASNAGSLAALLAYPVVIEPMMTTAGQAAVWTWCYAILGILLFLCGALVLRAPHAAIAGETAAAPAAAPTMPERLRWLALAFVPAALLGATTAKLSTDVAAAPFLWIVPLALYLTTFIVVFARKPQISQELALKGQLVAIVFAGLIGWQHAQNWMGMLLSGLFAFFFAALVVHGELARRKPDPRHLTEFYLVMSLGGVLGGLFNAFLAPALFNSIAEYPLLLVATLLVRPRSTAPVEKRETVAALFALAAFGMIVLLHLGDKLAVVTLAALLCVMGGACFIVRQRPAAAACVAALMFAIGPIVFPFALVTEHRGFFGVHRVAEQGEGGDAFRLLMHGTTIHGAQALSPERALTPRTYYHPEAPIGEAFTILNATGRIRSVGAVGMGVGSVTCYRQPGQSWSMFEIDPIVVKIAMDPKLFTFVRTCAPDLRIVLGDARLTLAAEPPASFDAMLLDAFSSDMVPVHLMTREALRLYLDRLSADGVIIFHVSNRNMDLARMLARVVAAEGAHARLKQLTATPEQTAEMISSSITVVIAKTEEVLAPFAQAGWSALDADGRRPWTDDFSNVVEAIWLELTKPEDVTQ